MVTSTSGRGGAIRNYGDLTLRLVELAGNESEGQGGAVFTEAGSNLRIEDSTFSDNEAGTAGGAIRADGSSGTTMSITGSTFSGNSAATVGGAIFFLNGGEVVLVTNSTFSGNSAPNGGAIRSQYRGFKFVNVTMTKNTATTQGGGFTFSNAAKLLAHNSIFVDNAAPSAADGWGQSTTFDQDTSFSLFGEVNQSVPNNDNQTGVTETLMPLGQYGGPTMTHALKPDSIAIDAGSDVEAANAELTTDQRGTNFDRKIGDAVDIGAVEAHVILRDAGGDLFK